MWTVKTELLPSPSTPRQLGTYTLWHSGRLKSLRFPTTFREEPSTDYLQLESIQLSLKASLSLFRSVKVMTS